MKGDESKGAAKADAKLAVKSKGVEKPANGRTGAGKDPNKPPERGVPNAFFIFMEEFRKEFKEKNPKNEYAAAEVGKAAADRWKSLTDADKASYAAKANELKLKYNKAIAAFNMNQEEEESDKSESEVNDEDDDEGSEEEEDDDE